ncbi:hypothetical protein EJ06DRAFT_530189 [Trichodelitschia bisporula]|uniref:Uncharacterized protein n=1 Tax=Trichodelitschia bisporula TaxID=703511 RepID=A0A6G1HVW8_9PEZI|nr:hypothetical protein EJ06DRAFT_530189 [Trichodelitschia bisporula]
MLPPKAAGQSAAQENDDTKDPRAPISAYDWEDVQQRVENDLKKRLQEQENVNKELEELMAYYMLWMKTISEHETERTHKRIRTRMHHIQSSEKALEQKREHYTRVINAFESALQLVNGQ